MTTGERGKWGEHLALKFLYSLGYSLVKKNFRSRFGEIDIIVKNKDFVVFVEVKVRKNSTFAHAREFVSRKKQNKMRSTANLWLSMTSKNESSKFSNLQPRFDVIEIYSEDLSEEPQINHIIDAF